MAINSELDKWLNDKLSGHLASPEGQALKAFLAKDDVAQVFNEGFLARSDYSRKMDELRAKEIELSQQFENRASSYEQQLATWKQSEQAQIDKWYADQQAYTAALEARLQQEGLQPEGQKPAAPTATPKLNGNGALSREDISRAVNEELARHAPQYAALPAIVGNLMAEHQKLFGNFPDMLKVTEKALQTNRPIQQVWEETYNVAQKRSELAEADLQRRIDDEVQKRLVAERSNAALAPAGRPGDPQSPIRQFLLNQKPKEGEQPLTAPAVQQVSEAVLAAEDAYRRGTFATKYPGQP